MNDYKEFTREELVHQLTKSKDILHMLSSAVLGGVAKMSLDSLHVLNASEGYYRMTGYTEEESHQAPFFSKGLNLVIPEDIPRIQSALSELVEDQHMICVDYRIRKKDGSIAWNTAYCSRIEEDHHGKYVDVFFVDSTKTKRLELQLSNLLDHIPCGCIRIQLDSDVKILYANRQFYEQIGYTAQEFSEEPFHDNLLKIVHIKDRTALTRKFENYFSAEQSAPLMEFRILTKDKQIRWIRLYVSALNETVLDENRLQCILMDVTAEREQTRKNMLNEERFRIIAEQTRDVVFDWDIASDSIHYSPMFEKMFGITPPPCFCISDILEGDLVLEEDKTVLQCLVADMRAAVPYVECRVRMKGKNNSYFWTLHQATTIYDEDRHSVLVVGIISDIDSFMKNTLALEHKVAHDPLTGLLNRVAAQSDIEEVLKNSKPDQIHIFAQFDIDRFKQINDFMGHAAGDLALRKTAEQMREVFGSEDLLIRMGGDEFAIFVVNPVSFNSAARKIMAFLQKTSYDFRVGQKVYPLSVSIGCSVYPADGNTFQELYEHADSALYQAKQLGGNRLNFFDHK